jgi:GGDEF domain-containing protein
MGPMTSLRKSILFILIHLTIVFNLERLDVNGQDVIDIQSFVYVVIIVAVLVTLVSRLLQRYSIYIGVFFWACVYIALKLFVFSSRPLLSGVYLYLTITELSLLTISIFLAYNLARSLTEFENVIERVTFPKQGERVVEMKAANEDIKTEFIRSRRHNRPLSVLMIEMDPNTNKIGLEQTVKRIQKTMLTRYLLASLAQVLTKEARRTDLIIEQSEQGGFVLLCPETTAEGSYVLAERIQALAMEQLGISVNCGVAAFPDEALTFDDLMQKARFSLLSPEKLATFIYPQSTEISVSHREKQS